MRDNELEVTSRGTILVVEDDESVARALSRRLGGPGRYEVLVAHSSHEAIRLIGNGIDFVLLDLNLGEEDMGGIECLRRFRLSLGYDGIVCILTGDETASTLLRAVDAGADGFLLKPVESVIEAIELMLRPGLWPRRDPVEMGDEGIASLRSRGLRPEQVNLCCLWSSMGFPQYIDIAREFDASAEAVSQRFVRIRKTLGLRSQYQLASMLQALCMLGCRRSFGPFVGILD